MVPARISASLLLGAWLAAPALADDDKAAVEAAIRENYAAYSSFDEARYRRTTTEDFLLLEHGKLIDREGDVALMAKPGTGFRRADHFDFDAVRIVGDTAYAVYTLESEIHDDVRGTRDREWPSTPRTARSASMAARPQQGGPASRRPRVPS